MLGVLGVFSLRRGDGRALEIRRKKLPALGTSSITKSRKEAPVVPGPLAVTTLLRDASKEIASQLPIARCKLRLSQSVKGFRLFHSYADLRKPALGE